METMLEGVEEITIEEAIHTPRGREIQNRLRDLLLIVTEERIRAEDRETPIDRKNPPL